MFKGENSCNSIKYIFKFSIGQHGDACELICSKLSIMLDTTKFKSTVYCQFEWP